MIQTTSINVSEQTLKRFKRLKYDMQTTNDRDVTHDEAIAHILDVYEKHSKSGKGEK